MTREEWIRDLRKIYAPVAVLSETSEKTVLRLRHRALGKDLVVRSYPSAVPAYEFLKRRRAPGFPEVYDTVPCADGCIVLEEWIESLPLSDYLLRSLFSYAGAAKILKKAALSLSVLHENGFVHRDLKPKNILITEKGALYIADLEAGRAVREGDDTTRLGTAGFAAPEQYVGKSDPRSDLFALGVILNVMLTGRHPSERLPQSKKARRVIKKATAQNPDDRYQSALDFADAL